MVGQVAGEENQDLVDRVKRRAGLEGQRTGFDALLPSHIAGKLPAIEVKKPSLVQKVVIPYLMAGQDAIVSSQTGTSSGSFTQKKL